MAMKIKIAIVTDIHNGSDHFTKKGSAALSLLKDFCDFAEGWNADIIMDTGDRIIDVDLASDKKHLNEVAQVFSTLTMQRGHLLGNHDVENLTPEDNADLLNVSMGSRIITINGYHLVIWQANTCNYWPDGLDLKPKDLAWIERALNEVSGPCIVFTHVPLDSGSMTGNYYFAENTRHATYPQVAEARRILEESQRVILCIAGHVHWNSLNYVNNIPYLTLHSLTECCNTMNDPSRAWATLEIGDNINWQVHGLEPIQITLPVPRTSHRWLTPRKPVSLA